MAIVKRGSRPIVVDGCHYRWTVCRKPTYSQAMAWSPLTFAVERVEPPGRAILVVRLSSAHPGNWVHAEATPVRPAMVAAAIRQALVRGWQPDRPGSPFVLDADLTL
ncbi:hypothetical protein O7632_09425 [Solwaraspora sp. WMMD406]|uniref:hypothetical protein n=1 Tax=Solwaraspora sp. WMMD406 TaxID=3016095 RepID=UPI0024180435|nr:hypothetical protein [Solwaraspora sp. WMMD406]MDG4764324.1 hypothetical protein [Solwaraspora sp. WMMD406]